MKIFKRTYLFSLILFSVLLTAMPCSAKAASAKWKKACKAYSTYLEKNESHYNMNYDVTSFNPEGNNTIYSFMLVDLDKNGIPELLGIHYKNAKSALINAFTYKNGEVKKLKEFTAVSTAQGSYVSYICRQRHFHLNYEGGFVGYNYCAYKLKSGEFYLYAQKNYEAIIGRNTITVNGKKTTSSRYNTTVKKCTRDKNITYYRNTASNRKKYLI